MTLALLPPLLLAGFAELIGALVTLVMLLLWVIGQIAEGKKQLARPAAPRPPAPDRGPANAAGQGAAKPEPAKQPPAGGIRAEMEEFLRRANAQKAARPAAANRPPAAPLKPQPPRTDRVEVLVDEQGRSKEARPLSDRPRPKESRQPLTPTIRAKGGPTDAGRRAAKVKRESVAEHVQQHMAVGALAMAEQRSHLGQRIIQEDAQFDVELKARFDHDVGTIASIRVTDTPSQSPDHRDANSPAGQLAALLASPQGVRQAIILNEILRRPSDR